MPLIPSRALQTVSAPVSPIGVRALHANCVTLMVPHDGEASRDGMVVRLTPAEARALIGDLSRAVGTGMAPHPSPHPSPLPGGETATPRRRPLGLTGPQRRMKDTIRRLTVDGVPPTISELAAALGKPGRGWVHDLVMQLIERGHAEHLPHKRRSLRLIEEYGP
jgi:hypothetical protein